MQTSRLFIIIPHALPHIIEEEEEARWLTPPCTTTTTTTDLCCLLKQPPDTLKEKSRWFQSPPPKIFFSSLENIKKVVHFKLRENLESSLTTSGERCVTYQGTIYEDYV
jgi:hypothetical protein